MKSIIAACCYALLCRLLLSGSFVSGQFVLRCPPKKRSRAYGFWRRHHEVAQDETDGTATQTFAPYAVPDDVSYEEPETDDKTMSQERQNGLWNSRYGFDSSNIPHLPQCDGPDDNIRGVYNSDLAPCEFSFHSSSNDPEDAHGSSFGHLPTVCTEKNKLSISNGNSKKTADAVKSVSQYAYNWKDECVGDFARCYSLTKHEHIYLKFACRKEWKVPAGATHMSVNCTKDKKLKEDKIKQIRNSNNNMDHHPYASNEEKKLQHYHQRWYDMKAFLTVLISVLVLLCLGFSLLAYKLVIKPYLKTMEERQEWNAHLHRKKYATEEDDDDDVKLLGGSKLLMRRRAQEPSDP